MGTRLEITDADVRNALTEVMDPEIPHLSIVDLGIVHRVETNDEGIVVAILPTFVGCPALEVIKESVLEKLEEIAPGRPISVTVTMDEPWTTDRISERGREILKSSGFAPPVPRRPMPPRANLIQLLPVAECPYCNSRNTTLDNAFGPTLCRAIYYCRDCRQPFEQFKQV
jgi:ring-1,2-phenylacetyl-CoA epoxidase subunit PaaD